MTDELIRKMFDLESVLALQRTRDIQIIRGEDYNYHLYIDRECWSIGQTPMEALVIGVRNFFSHEALRE